MDPQGRVLLETTAGALADAAAGAAGPAPAATGVYVGVMHMEYIQYMTGMQYTLILLYSLVHRKKQHTVYANS
jgi:acyl transferase domain-containing protein